MVYRVYCKFVVSLIYLALFCFTISKYNTVYFSMVITDHTSLSMLMCSLKGMFSTSLAWNRDLSGGSRGYPLLGGTGIPARILVSENDQPDP